MSVVTRAAGFALIGLLVAGCHLKSTDAVPPDQVGRKAESGAATVIGEETLENYRVTRVEQLLEARVAGVTVRRMGNGEYSVLIRGINAIHGTSQPLFVVDGVPLLDQRSLAAINPADVARIEVLKDAMAASYGVRGAHGVILITTRQ
jgi:TonB-dependent starch-binding outer membrane protein SusC